MFKFFGFLLSLLLFCSNAYKKIGFSIKHQFKEEAKCIRQNVAKIEQKWKNLDKEALCENIRKALVNPNPYNPKR